MRFDKLVGAGLKLGAAAASGACAVMFVAASGGNLTNGGLAVVSGLGVSTAVLAKQAVTDAVSAFKDGEQE